jgi:hypothetical protein
LGLLKISHAWLRHFTAATTCANPHPTKHPKQTTKTHPKRHSHLNALNSPCLLHQQKQFQFAETEWVFHVGSVALNNLVFGGSIIDFSKTSHGHELQSLKHDICSPKDARLYFHVIFGQGVGNKQGW